MLSYIKKLLGRDEKFFDLLDASAKQANESAQILLRLHAGIGKEGFAATLRELSDSRRKDKRISDDLTRALCSTFVTPIEREDIGALAGALYKIPKTIEKIGIRLAMSPERFSNETVLKQFQNLARATDILVGMTHSLRRIAEVDKIKNAYQQLQVIEGELDKFMLEALREFYQGGGEMREILIFQDFHEMQERAIDLCRDAGKVIFQVALKYA